MLLPDYEKVFTVTHLYHGNLIKILDIKNHRPHQVRCHQVCTHTLIRLVYIAVVRITGLHEVYISLNGVPT